MVWTRRILVSLVAVVLVAGVGIFARGHSSEASVEKSVSLFGRTPGTGFGGCPIREACFLTGSVSFVELNDVTSLRGSVTFTRWPAGPNPTDQSITINVVSMTIDDDVATIKGFVISDFGIDFGTKKSLIDAGDADDVVIVVDADAMTIDVTLDTDGMNGAGAATGGPFTLMFANVGTNVAVVAIDS